MKKLLMMILGIFFLFSCSILHQPPTNTIINYKDSTITHLVDSVIYIPKERVVDIVPIYDTLKLETNQALAHAYVDTSLHVLKGDITNKEGIKYKYIYKDKIVVKDSIITKEIQVPVEVIKEKKTHYWYEKILWFFSLIGLTSLVLIIYKIYKKFSCRL